MRFNLEVFLVSLALIIFEISYTRIFLFKQICSFYRSSIVFAELHVVAIAAPDLLPDPVADRTKTMLPVPRR
jgi:hypothetical protein